MLSFASASHAAQIQQIIPPESLNLTRPPGDRIRFCINPASALADFDRSVGTYLADLLLLPSEFHELSYPATPYPLEYGLLLPETELFIQIRNNCDALLGYPLPEMDQIFEWLTVTAPYYRPQFVLALASSAPDSLENMPTGTDIGSRIGILADMHVRAGLREFGGRLGRRVYPTNQAIITDLASGALAGAIIWEPAATLAARSDPAAASIRIVNSPFRISPVQFAIALPANQTYLRELLDPAIVQLRASDMFADLLSEAGLPAE